MILVIAMFTHFWQKKNRCMKKVLFVMFKSLPSSSSTDVQASAKKLSGKSLAKNSVRYLSLR